MTAKVSVVHPQEFVASLQIVAIPLLLQAGSLCYIRVPSVAGKKSSHYRSRNGGDPGTPLHQSSKTLCALCASAREKNPPAFEIASLRSLPRT